MFLLKKILTQLVLPPVGPLLITMLGLALRKRLPKASIWLAWLGIASLFALSLPTVAGLFDRLAGHHRTVDLARARTAQAIVVLAGGRKPAAEYGGETISWWTLERVRYAARLTPQLPLPLLVSGGSVYGGSAEALLMRDILEREFRVKVRWTESASRDTRENALYSAQILKGAGIGRVVLVTHAIHMARARREFAEAGIETVPAPVGVDTDTPVYSFVEYLPSASALRSSSAALHELLGRLAQRLRYGDAGAMPLSSAGVT